MDSLQYAARPRNPEGQLSQHLPASGRDVREPLLPAERAAHQVLLQPTWVSMATEMRGPVSWPHRARRLRSGQVAAGRRLPRYGRDTPAGHGPWHWKQFPPLCLTMTEHRVRPRSQGGRKSKGDRVPCTVRFPVELHEVVVQAASDAGYDSFQDFMIDLVEAARQAGIFPPARPGRLPIGA